MDTHKPSPIEASSWSNADVPNYYAIPPHGTDNAELIIAKRQECGVRCGHFKNLDCDPVLGTVAELREQGVRLPSSLTASELVLANTETHTTSLGREIWRLELPSDCPLIKRFPPKGTLVVK